MMKVLTSLLLYLSRSLKRFFYGKLYSDIYSLPIGVFLRVSKNNNLELLSISGRHSKKALSMAWRSILDQYIKEFGLSDDYRQYLELKSQSIMLWHDVYIKGHTHKIILAKIKDEQAKEISSIKGKNEGELIALLSRKMGFRIDPSSISVYEFYSYLKAQNGGEKNII